MNCTTLAAPFVASLVAVSSASAAGICCFADLNDDGTVDGADLGILLADWGPGSGVGDLNEDTFTDGADLGLLLAAWGPCPPAINDECGSSIALGGQVAVVEFCNATATDSEGVATLINSCGDSGPTTFHKDIWYTYTAVHTGMMEVFTCGGANFDTSLAIYESTISDLSACPGPFAFFTELSGCDDDSCGGLQSYVSVPASSGKAYVIRLASYQPGFGSAGELTVVNIKQGDLPELCHPLPSSFIQDVVGTTAGDTAIQADPTSCANGDTLDEWYCFTMPCQGNLTVSTCNAGTDFDTTLALFHADTMAPIACDDDIGPGNCAFAIGEFASEVSVNLNGGESILIRVSGYQGASGDFVMTVDADCIG